jgi:predicted LPLAT superfamily acyltransferase
VNSAEVTSIARNAADWHARPERGSMLMLRVISWISLRLGRPAGRVILNLIAGYFLLFAPASRVASRLYLSRVLSRPVGWRDIYKHFFWFASTIHDRIYLLNQRFDLFDIQVHGKELVLDALDKQQGLLLFGGHIGSFEVIRAIGRANLDLKVVMAMYEENARKLNQMLAAINPTAQQDVVGLGRIDSMMKLSGLLDQGSLVGILADRTLGDDAMVPVTLFGEPAHMPVSAFRMAAVLRRPVLFMVGLYTRGNRYEIHFEPIVDFTATPRQNRQQEITRAVAVYAALIEKHCRRAPYNWFNFFDFWNAAAPDSGQLETRSDP